ncbi:MAG: hypothetical protein ABJE47_23320 [bacterium]
MMDAVRVRAEVECGDHLVAMYVGLLDRDIAEYGARADAVRRRGLSAGGRYVIGRLASITLLMGVLVWGSGVVKSDAFSAGAAHGRCAASCGGVAR